MSEWIELSECLIVCCCCCWRRWCWCFSYNGCFQLENCFILLHVCTNTHSYWMRIVCRSAHRLSYIRIKISRRKIFETTLATACGKITQQWTGNLSGKDTLNFPYAHFVYSNIMGNTRLHINTSYSRNGTLLPLGSIHMALYNSYNGLLIVALKLFKKQYKRKWFYGTFCLVSFHRACPFHPIFDGWMLVVYSKRTL